MFNFLVTISSWQTHVIEPSVQVALQFWTHMSPLCFATAFVLFANKTFIFVTFLWSQEVQNSTHDVLAFTLCAVVHFSAREAGDRDRAAQDARLRYTTAVGSKTVPPRYMSPVCASTCGCFHTWSCRSTVPFQNWNLPVWFSNENKLEMLSLLVHVATNQTGVPLPNTTRPSKNANPHTPCAILRSDGEQIILSLSSNIYHVWFLY
jgi:hypothetical protein